MYAREFLAGLTSAGVLGCGKHFPGLGEGKLDSHHELPVIEKSWKALWAQDLAPYRALRTKLPFVMVSHAAYPEVTGDATPASISRKWISQILRKKIGYRGVIASDDLEMGGVLSAVPIEQAAVQHIREAERDRRFAARVSDAARRVLARKKRTRDLARLQPAPNKARVTRLSRQLWEFAEEVRLAGISRQESA